MSVKFAQRVLFREHNYVHTCFIILVRMVLIVSTVEEFLIEMRGKIFLLNLQKKFFFNFVFFCFLKIVNAHEVLA